MSFPRRADSTASSYLVAYSSIRRRLIFLTFSDGCYCRCTQALAKTGLFIWKMLLLCRGKGIYISAFFASSFQNRKLVLAYICLCAILLLDNWMDGFM